MAGAPLSANRRLTEAADIHSRIHGQKKEADLLHSQARWERARIDAHAAANLISTSLAAITAKYSRYRTPGDLEGNVEVTSRHVQTNDEPWLVALQELGGADCGVWFPRSEMTTLAADLVEILADPTVESAVPEVASGATRTIFGIHRLRRSFELLAKNGRLVSAAETILGEPVYLYQSKLNPKDPGSHGWDWHVDFQAWSRDDGMPEPRAVTFAVYIDDVTSDAGPLTVLGGSHTYFGSWGLAEAKPVGDGDGSAAWRADFGVDLKYAPPRDFVAKLLRECPEVPLPGTSGSVMAFLAATVHGSASNGSSNRRAVVYLTYNAESNRPRLADMKRPPFIVER